MRTTLIDIIESDESFEVKAARCLVNVSQLPPEDLAVARYLGAAQTFALLAINDKLVSGPSGRNLAEAVCQAGGIQP